MKGFEVLVNGGLVARVLDTDGKGRKQAEAHAQFHRNLAKEYGRGVVVVIRPADWTERELELETLMLSGAEVFDGVE